MIGKWLTTYWPVVSGVGSAAGLLAGALWRYWLRHRWRALKAWWTTMAALPSEIKTLHAQLAVVKAQVLPNSGKSLDDKLAQTAAIAQRIEEGLEAHRAFAMAMQDIQGVAFFKTEERGRVSYASTEMSEVVGNAALGADWIAAIHPEDRRRIVAELHEALGEQRRWRESLRFRHADGHEVAGVIECRPVIVSGRFAGFVGVFKAG